MADEFVKEGAVLRCSLGLKTCELKVPESHGVLLKQGNRANISDNKAVTNIPSFNKCNRCMPQVECVPTIISKWVKAKKGILVDGDLALTKDCVLPCLYGGIISIEM